jgi:hypothetical protein
VEKNKFDLEYALPVKKHRKLPRPTDERKQRKSVEPGIRIGHWTQE